MRNQVRSFARKVLPTGARKFLGNAVGKFEERFRVPVILPLQGILFDLFCHGQFKADNCVFEIPKALTSRFIRGCFFDNTYEISERTVIQKFVRPDDSVIELGGCLGIVSCTTNKLLQNKSRHLVVEANPQCVPALQRNRDLNQCSFRIENCAASNQPEVTLFLDPKLIVSGTTKSASAFQAKVAGRSLAELCRQYGPFSALIMDIEGSELDVLQSSEEILSNFRLIVVEFHPWIIGADGVSRCCDILRQSGFNMIERVFHNEAWLRN